MANKTLRRGTGINIRIQCHIHFVFFLTLFLMPSRPTYGCNYIAFIESFITWFIFVSQDGRIYYE